MPTTPRLYFDDPFLSEFEATVVGASPSASETTLLLSQTAFYPEAGGQMADRGFLELGDQRFDVLDVQADDDGVVEHRLGPGATFEVGAVVRGRIDKARRRVHMALHTGQHLLSRALLDEASAGTVSARLGESGCTIDVDVPAIDEAALSRAEDLVNDVIDDDLGIRAFFPSAEELGALPLRRAPKVTDNVRVVQIGAFDTSPCGGTHCTRTAQVGLVKVVGLERYKGKVRVHFTAGKRARSELSSAHRALGALAERLTTSPANAATAVDKMRADFAAERDRARAIGRALAERVAVELAASAVEGVVAATIPHADVELLRSIAGRVTACGVVALLAGEEPEGRPVVFSRPAGSSFECGATLKRIAAAAGGRGGGRAEHAEGRLPTAADLAACWRQASRVE